MQLPKLARLPTCSSARSLMSRTHGADLVYPNARRLLTDVLCHRLEQGHSPPRCPRHLSRFGFRRESDVEAGAVERDSATPSSVRMGP